MEYISSENNQGLSWVVIKMWRFIVNWFRKNNSLKNYDLCPTNYLAVLVSSWNAILNMKKVELEFIADPDMYLFFEKCMRGGVSYISNRWSKFMKKYLKS